MFKVSYRFYESYVVTFSNATTFTVINEYCKGAVIEIATVFQPICHGPLKHSFLDKYLTTFFGAGISGNTSAMRVSFFWQMFIV